MDRSTKRTTGIISLVVCAICLFVAGERYLDNANKVEAMDRMGGGAFAELVGQRGPMRPAMPAATKYALFFALVSGVGGGVLIAQPGSGGAAPGARYTSGDHMI